MGMGGHSIRRGIRQRAKGGVGALFSESSPRTKGGEKDRSPDPAGTTRSRLTFKSAEA
jgi:hypothetical protein